VTATDNAGNITTSWPHAYTIDTVAPTITNVTSTKTDATYTVGEVIVVRVVLSESVTVTGTPQLTLETGTTDAVVNYTSWSGSNILLFTYTVAAGENSLDLDYISTIGLALNWGTIKDNAMNDTTLTLATPGSAGSLGANKALVIDTDSPTPGSAPDMTAGTDSGTSNTDNLTSDTTPDFTGICTNGDTVNLKNGATLLGSITCAGGTYTVLPSAALGDGAYTLTVTFTDPIGNESAASPGLSVTIDSTTDAATGTPDVTSATDSGSSNSDNITSDTTPTFDISCVTGSLVTLYDNVTSIGTGTCAGGTVTITSSTLSEWVHASINATQTDTAWNISVASANISVTIDTTADAATGAPDVTSATDLGSSNTDDITSDDTPNFTISCVTGSLVTLYDNITSIGTGTCAGGTVTITASTLSEW
jgi:Bacterial Ig-like domain